MCYGICDFEGYMGECEVRNSTKVEEELGYTPCFIGGAVFGKEEEDFYNKLDENGTLKKLKNKIYEKYM